MLKDSSSNSIYGKVFFVAVFTGVGHLLAVALYPILTRYLSSDIVSEVGLMDANIMLVVGWLGFGLNAAATRDIALSQDWKPILARIQSARVSLALLFSIIAACALIFGGSDEKYFWVVLLLSPVLALNYDFALYGLGKPKQAAIISFVRQSLPIIVFMSAIFLIDVESWQYLLLMIMFLFISSSLVSYSCGAKLFYYPSKSFLATYWGAAAIGVAGIFLGLQRYGFVNIYAERMSDDDFVVLIAFLKVILFSVGCKRMLIQIFYNKLLEKKVAYGIDLFCIFSALVIIVISVTFSEYIASYLFGGEKYSYAVKILSVGIFSCLFFVTSDSKLLLLRRDNWMSLSTILVAILMISTLYVLREHLTLKEVLQVIVVAEFLLSASYWLCSIVGCKKEIEVLA